MTNYNTDEEVWKDAVGYEGYHRVSNTGKVMGVKKFPNMPENRLLNGSTSKHGYIYVHLRKYGIGKKEKVHRLVAKAFVPNPQNKPQVNHKDGDKKNNCASNLEWATSRENNIHALRTGLRKTDLEQLARAQNISAKKAMVKIDKYSVDGEYICTYESLKDAAEAIGVKGTAGIVRVAKGRGRTAYGYKWKYE